MSLSNLFQQNGFNIYLSTVDGSNGSLTIGKNASTLSLHLGDTATPVYINERLYTGSNALSIAPVGSSSNSNGMTLNNGVLNLEPTNGTYPGTLSIGTQSVSGQKIFNTGIAFNNPTSGYLIGQLDYYDTFDTSFAMTGAANLTFNCSFTRIGRVVTLSWTSPALGTATSGPSLQLTTASGVVPARYLKVNMSGVINVIDGSTSSSIKNGCIFFLSGGAINITAANNGSFTNPGFCGWLPGAISYSI